ncbi:MAG: hypothetical protein KBD53_00750 [Candidatus Omnitrophica bacterium]|nr:hypothetical protein [Candidatus Omnitrophota bacterium]
MTRRFILLSCIFLLFLCGKLSAAADNSVETTAAEVKSEKPIEPDVPQSSYVPFYVYSDKGARSNHYVPSGFMPDGQCVVFNDQWRENCESGKTCIKVTYDIECSRNKNEWAGIYWLNPANNWGRRKGGYNLTGATKMTFWAKGELGGEQIQEFTIGGIEGDFPDTDKIVIGPVILSDKWREYSIDLQGKDLSYISGGFAWTTEVAVNPDNCVFYLDNIKFE